MSDLTAPDLRQNDPNPPDPFPSARPPRDPAALLRDAVLVLGPFAVLGVVGALVWDQLATLPEYTTTKTNAVMDQIELAKQFSADGWYIVIAVVGGLLAGLLLTIWRDRDALATMGLVIVGSLLAAYVMLEVGLLLGPANPKDVFAHAAVGQKVPLQLKPGSGNVLHFHGISIDLVVLVWPIAALVGALGVLWGTSPRVPQTVPEGARQPNLG